jgi:cell division protein FtsW
MKQMSAANVFRRKTGRARPGTWFHFDYWLALTVAGLVVIGMLMVYSTTFVYGLRFYEDATYFFGRQALALILGLVGGAIILFFDYHALRRASLIIMGGTLLLLLFVLLIGDQIFGARRGLLEGSLQPSEVAKLATILYISHWLSTKGERVKDLTYGLLPFSVITGLVCGLIVLQPDLGTSILIALIAFTLFFVAGADLRQFAIAGAVGGASFLLLTTILPHAAARIDSFKEAWTNPVGAGWHIQQTVVALGSGGLFGVGLGESTQKFGPLPAAHTDGVFAILGEELGFVGCLIVLALLGTMTLRGVRTAQRARDSYGFLLAAGITCWLAYQALINVAVITAVIPITGMPLPFLSYGGSSLTTSLIGIALLLNISRDAATRVKVQGEKPIRETIRESFDLRRRNGRPHLSGAERRR